MCTHLHIQHIFQPFITEKNIYIADLEQVFRTSAIYPEIRNEKQMSSERGEKKKSRAHKRHYMQVHVQHGVLCE